MKGGNVTFNLTKTKSKKSGLKLVYSKQPILGLTQEFCCVGGSCRNIKLSEYRDEVCERTVIVNELIS